jgi:hypothetical protein
VDRGGVTCALVTYAPDRHSANCHNTHQALGAIGGRSKISGLGEPPLFECRNARAISHCLNGDPAALIVTLADAEICHHPFSGIAVLVTFVVGFALGRHRTHFLQNRREARLPRALKRRLAPPDYHWQNHVTLPERT